MGKLNPNFYVGPLTDVSQGNLVRHSSDSTNNEFAITAIGPTGEQRLVLLNPNSSQITYSTQHNGNLVAVLGDWQIEPIDISVGNTSVGDAKLKLGSLLACRDEEAAVTIGLVLQDGLFFDLTSFMIRNSVPGVGLVAVTRWKLWTPEFSPDSQPRWRPIFEFPKARG